MTLPPLPVAAPPRVRNWPAFVSSTLNSERFGNITLNLKAHNSNFEYFSFRRPNRFSGSIHFDEASIFTCCGIRGGGKSTTLEDAASHYPKVIDAYGSRDDESLAWCRASKFNEGRYERVLILGPPSTDLTSSWDYKHYTALTLNDIETHEVIIMPQKPFPSLNSFFKGNQALVDLIWSRPKVTDLWFLLIREAQNLLYSRIFLKRSAMDQAKAYLVLLMREMRHMGVGIGMDSQYLIALEKEVRLASDYTIVKNMGSYLLPRELSWIYRYVTPGGLRALEKDEFVAMDKWGGLYLGKNTLPPWHKSPKEDLYEELGISYTWGDQDEVEAETLDDESQEDIIVHQEIVQAYLATRSVAGAARQTGHQRETVRKHVERHRLKTCSCFRQALAMDER